MIRREDLKRLFQLKKDIRDRSKDMDELRHIRDEINRMESSVEVKVIGTLIDAVVILNRDMKYERFERVFMDICSN